MPQQQALQGDVFSRPLAVVLVVAMALACYPHRTKEQKERCQPKRTLAVVLVVAVALAWP